MTAQSVLAADKAVEAVFGVFIQLVSLQESVCFGIIGPGLGKVKAGRSVVEHAGKEEIPRPLALDYPHRPQPGDLRRQPGFVTYIYHPVNILVGFGSFFGQAFGAAGPHRDALGLEPLL